ncbi:MAG: tetratricopeptide repeat protein [Nitrospiraceae bacterium]|nr:tetratricopeptide repeat protein [Nitrospiraceae bacterium]
MEPVSRNRHAVTAHLTPRLVLSCVVLFLLTGVSLQRNDLYRTEERLLADMAQKSPGKPRAFYNLGCLEYEQGKYDDAIRNLSRSLELYQNRKSDDKRATGFFAHAHAVRGSVYLKLSRVDRALDDLNTAIALDPFSADAYRRRSVALREARWFSEAIEDLNVVIQLDPADAASYRERGVLFERTSDPVRAIEDLTEAVSLDPADAEAYLERAKAYGKQGDRSLELKDYEKACELGVKAGCEAARK